MRVMHIVCAGAAALAAAQPLAAQLSDQSGPLTFSLQIAKHVEVVSHAPSAHNLTQPWDSRGGRAPGGVVSTNTLHASNPTIREIRANTPFRVSVVGLTPDRKLVFRNARGDELSLTTACDMLPSSDVRTRSLQTVFDCLNSPVFPAGQSMVTRWVLFYAYTPLATDTNDAAAGVYTATIYVQIEAT